MADSPCGTLVQGINGDIFHRHLAACLAARMIFLLLGRMMILSVGRFSIAWKISSVLGFMVCPPSTIAATPRLAKMREMPGPARYRHHGDLAGFHWGEAEFSWLLALLDLFHLRHQVFDAHLW